MKQSPLNQDTDGLNPQSDHLIHLKLSALKDYLDKLDNLIVAFSGGVDSALLLKVAVDTMAERVVAMTTTSASLPQSEEGRCRQFALELGVEHYLIPSNETKDPNYAANPFNRCFYCKQSLFKVADSLKVKIGFNNLALGTNLDDLGDHRPGLKAAAEYGALHPLVDAGFSKDDVRAAARLLGLEVWDQPSMACLSSRFPYGTSITDKKLEQIERAEALVHSLGFSNFRVRYHGDVARIEVSEEALIRIMEPQIRTKLAAGMKALDFKYISVDIEPFRSGRLNEII